jgi:hypothetical protein
MSWRMRSMVAMVAVLVAASVAGADSYTGSLSSKNYCGGEKCIKARGLWRLYNWKMSWEVTDEALDAPDSHPWKYTYTFGTKCGLGLISELILEASAGDPNGIGKFELDNLWGLEGNAELVGIDSFASEPGIPEAIYGIKLKPEKNCIISPSMSFSFYSDRAPVWGDFYTRGWLCRNYAYNKGFALDDPTDPASNGSLNCHILVPDTFDDTPGGDNPVAEPSALALMVLSGLGLTARRRRS